MAIEIKEQELYIEYQHLNRNNWRDFEEYKNYRILDRQEKGQYIYFYPSDGAVIKFDSINNFPLKEYEIWMEGYSATGESGTAHLLGKIEARNFAQACHIYAAESYLEEVEKINSASFKEYRDFSRWDYDTTRYSIWACRLFWSEELARKSFG